MDYTSRYGMDFNPFIKNAKEIVVETSDYKEVICRLNYLLNNKGFGILTGGPGRGKTTIMRNWSAGLNTSLYKVIYSSLSTLTVVEFYKNLYPKGFQHHIDNQGLAWNRTSELYQLKLALNRLLATVSV